MVENSGAVNFRRDVTPSDLSVLMIAKVFARNVTVRSIFSHRGVGVTSLARQKQPIDNVRAGSGYR